MMAKIKRLKGFWGLWVTAFLLLSLTGCSMHMTKRFADKLVDQDDIYKSFNVSPTDLSQQSKCKTPPAVKIVNRETRTEDFAALINPPSTGVINPREMMDSVCLYLKKGFEKSGIKGDDQSDKILELKMEDLKSKAGVWSFGSYFKVELTIPETKQKKYYEATDSTMNGLTAGAYAIHGVTRKIIDDPVIQDYLLCR